MYTGEWYSRGYLPHFTAQGSIVSVTTRLADSLPTDWLLRVKQTIPRSQAGLRNRLIDTYLDKGKGECWLGLPTCAKIVEDELFSADGTAYNLIAWVIMPNHLHLLVHLSNEVALSKVMFVIKGRTARFVNQAVGRKGSLWQKEYFDRMIRNEEHFRNTVEYIHNNPVKAQLVTRAEEWRYSSAGRSEYIARQQAVLGHIPELTAG